MIKNDTKISKDLIEKNIPIPPMTKNSVYPFQYMEIGDSFYTTASINKLSTAASIYGKRHQKGFTIRKEGEGHRVWRCK
jgi:hypothetical protein